MACEVCPGQFRHYIAPANPNMNDWRTTILHDRGGLKYKWFVIMGSKSTILQQKFRNFGLKIRRESHRIARATAYRRSAQCLGTSAGRGQAAAREAQRISARSRAVSIAKFRGREFFLKFSKMSVRNSPKIAPNLTRHSMPTLGTEFRDL